MNKGTKIVLWIIGGVVFLGVVGIAVVGYFGYKYFAKSTSTDPKQVESLAREITDYELPAGYKPAFSTNIMGMQMAAFQRSEKKEGQVIFFWQIAKDSPLGQSGDAQKQIEKAIDESVKNQGGKSEGREKVTEREVTIRGKKSRLVEYAFQSEKSNERMRQLLATFEGKSGLATLHILGPEDSFNEAEINSFINSLK